MVMGFSERWQVWHEAEQARREAEQRARIEQARAGWLGRLVRYYAPEDAVRFADQFISHEGWVYGEVIAVTEEGLVEVVVAFHDDGGMITESLTVGELGTRCVLADVLPYEMAEEAKEVM